MYIYYLLKINERTHKYQFNMYKATFCVESPLKFMKKKNQIVKHFRGLYSRALFYLKNRQTTK